MQTNLSTRRYCVTGSQRTSNSIWAFLLSLGAFVFLSIGFHSFLERGALETEKSQGTIQFFPQGLVMCFYGVLAVMFAMYLWLTLFWKVGDGFNEFDKESGILRIFRWGLPGKDRRIDLRYKIEQVESLHFSSKSGRNPKRTVSLQLRGKQAINLTRIGQPIPLRDIENAASELAQFLQVSLQTFY